MPHNRFCVPLDISQLFFLVLFGLFSQHDSTAKPSTTPLGNMTAEEAQRKYTDFQDMHGTLIISFGFLVALRRYGFASFTMPMMLTSLTMELALLVRDFLTGELANSGKLYGNLQNMINADYTAAVVLISYSKTSGLPYQRLGRCLFRQGRNCRGME